MTVALGSNIANPISTALSQWPGFDTMGKLANYGKLGATDPDAVIKALFAASEVGVWYDPSDLTTMFQDRAGTTPVTADGQTVGKILDKSGRGNHATAPSDAARPLYKTDGTYHWLQFDGVDDSLSTAAIDFTSCDNVGIWAGSYRPNATNSVIVGFAPQLSSGSFQLDVGWSEAGKVGGFISGSSTYLYGHSGVAYPLNSPFTASLIGYIDQNAGSTATTGAFYVQGALAPAPSLVGATAKTGHFANSTLHIGISGSASVPLNGRIYSLIVRMAASTTQEITDTETWVNSKTGAWA